jgi:hypothetical protein
MESITAFVACGAAFALSYFIGHSMASSSRVAAMMGAVSGAAFSVVFFISTVAIGAVIPGMFEGWSLGIHFILLLAIAPAGSAGIAVLEHRHHERIESRRLPF